MRDDAQRGTTRRHSRPPLTQQERQDLAVAWPAIVCRWCGMGHPGVCPRVRRIRTTRLPNGTYNEDVELWPNGKWEPPPDAIAAGDIWPGGVPLPPAVIDADATDTTGWVRPEPSTPNPTKGGRAKARKKH